MSRPLRSILFVPGDNPSRMAKAAASGADAIVIDLEDAVAPARKPEARGLVSEFLASRRGQGGVELWVRINPIATEDALADLSAVMDGAPTAILLPKAAGPQDLAILGHYLDAFEVREGLVRGSTHIIPVATETAVASQALNQYGGQHIPRLRALTWGAEDLSADLGAATNMDETGALALTYRLVRSQTLLAAKASSVEAIDTVYPDFRDLDGLRRACLAARREGFSACFAIHPAQVSVINEAFSPSEADVAHAQRVIDAFAAQPHAGAVALDGKMLDMPHLKQARKILTLSGSHADYKRITGALGV